ncbi:MAG: dimethyl sulfoxide reductase anchor subunit family protein [Acidiferrobacterales bacterium]
MRPAFSVVFLTTLIGVGQGLFLALFATEACASIGLLPVQSATFFGRGTLIAASFLVAGLISSFFHLGHPERAWRAATKWRTSWLAREVIALPVATGAIVVYGLVHYLHWTIVLPGVRNPLPDGLSLIIGAGAVAATLLLFLCTGMIYACIRFLQEWATWLTVVNYLLFGMASGFVLASAYSAYQSPQIETFLVTWATVITAVALVTRSASLFRNSRIRHKSSLQTAIGVRHGRITQTAQGFMGGSFNTRDFFHGVSPVFLRSLKWVFLLLVFPVPVLLLWTGVMLRSPAMELAAFVVQYLGLVVERWFFFAQANHPQNLYYQAIS